MWTQPELPGTERTRPFSTCLHPRRVSCFYSRFAGKWSGHSAGAESPPRLIGCGSVPAVGFLLAFCWQNMDFSKREFSIECGAYLMCGLRSWQKCVVLSSRATGRLIVGFLAGVGAIPTHPERASTLGIEDGL